MGVAGSWELEEGPGDLPASFPCLQTPSSAGSLRLQIKLVQLLESSCVCAGCPGLRVGTGRERRLPWRGGPWGGRGKRSRTAAAFFFSLLLLFILFPTYRKGARISVYPSIRFSRL